MWYLVRLKSSVFKRFSFSADNVKKDSVKPKKSILTQQICITEEHQSVMTQEPHSKSINLLLEDSASLNVSVRIYYWDNFKGLLIFLVVFAHWLLYANQILIHIIVDGIYMFHMPAFVFISGYFGKSAHSHSPESILRLLTAYILFDGLFSIVSNDYSLLTPFAIYWYIFALIVWRLSAPLLSRIKHCLLFLTVISLVIGYSKEINGTLSLSRIISFAPFYMAGYLLSDNIANKLSIKKSPVVFITGLASAALAIVVGIYSYVYIGFERADLMMFPYRIPESGVLGRMCLFFVSALSIYALGTVVPNRRIPLLSRFGRCSLPIYLFHIFLHLLC